MVRSATNPDTHPEAAGSTPDVPAGSGSGLRGPDTTATTRAFVVQVTSGHDEGDTVFTGRVQHLATADGGNFATPEDLIEIMRRVLRRDTRRDDPRDE